MKKTLRQVAKYKHCYLWIAPFFILFVLFKVWPMIYGLLLSFTDYNGFTEAQFVGLANYTKMFTTPAFWRSLWNTVVLWALIVPARTFVALILAAILNSKKLLGRKVYSVVVLLPYVTAVVVVANIFRVFLATNGGLVNVLLGSFGIGPIGWLDTTTWSKASIAIMNIWRMSGYFSIVLLAGMQKISPSVYEAADLDGAGPVRKFFKITLPIMVPEIFFVVLMSTIWIFQNVADVMVLTGGGPLQSSTTLIYYLYVNAFEYFNMGYSSAVSFVLFIILMLLSTVSVRKQYGKEGD